MPRNAVRNRLLRRLSALLIVAPAVLLLSACDENDAPTGLRFSHEKHLGRGYSCGLCHLSENFNEPARPKERICRYCHDKGHHEPPGKHCALCHARMDLTVSSVSRPTFEDVPFDHETHTDAGMPCQECHRKQTEAETYDAIIFTQMKACVACHEVRGVERECRTCHGKQRKDLEPPSHREFWTERHGRESRGRFDENCVYCHESEAFCQECHQAEAPKSHTLFFRNRGHGSEVENERLGCQPCHGQDFCLACHDGEGGAKPASHTGAFGGRRPYLHCASCHFPGGKANGCAACHDASSIHEAHTEDPPSPVPDFVVDSPFFPGCLDQCHPFSGVPPRHPVVSLRNRECLICHEAGQ